MQSQNNINLPGFTTILLSLNLSRMTSDQISIMQVITNLWQKIEEEFFHKQNHKGML